MKTRESDNEQINEFNPSFNRLKTRTFPLKITTWRGTWRSGRYWAGKKKKKKKKKKPFLPVRTHGSYTCPVVYSGFRSVSAVACVRETRGVWSGGGRSFGGSVRLAGWLMGTRASASEERAIVQTPPPSPAALSSIPITLGKGPHRAPANQPWLDYTQGPRKSPLLAICTGLSHSHYASNQGK